MVISPQKLQEILREKRKRKEERIKQLETGIDQALLERWEGEYTVTVPLDKKEDQEIINEIVNKYMRAGWEVKHLVDPQGDPFQKLQFYQKR